MRIIRRELTFGRRACYQGEVETLDVSMNRRHLSEDRVADPPVEELDRVRLTCRLDVDGGHTLEVGSKGTVVSVYGGGQAFCVEFTSPVEALVTVGREDFEIIAEETIARLASSSKPIRR